MACSARSSEGLGEEEVLHVDDDESRFGGVDGNGDGGGFECDFGGRNWGRWRGRMGEVKAMMRVVQPEVGWLPDERLSCWVFWVGIGLHPEVTGT